MAKKKNSLAQSPIAPLTLGKPTASTQGKAASKAQVTPSAAAVKTQDGLAQSPIAPLTLSRPAASAQSAAAPKAQVTPSAAAVKAQSAPTQARAARGDGTSTGAGGVSMPVLRQLTANSMAWHKADAKERNRLELANAKLRAQAKLTYDSSTGRTMAGQTNLSAPVEVAHGGKAAKASALRTLDEVQPLEGSLISLSPAASGARYTAATDTLNAQKEERMQELRTEYAQLKQELPHVGGRTAERYAKRIDEIKKEYDAQLGVTLGSRLGHAARSIVENMTGALPALGENLRQMGVNEASNQDNAALQALREQAAALELELNSYYASGASAYGMSPDMTDKQKQLDALRAEIDKARDKTPVNPRKYGQRTLQNAAYDVKQATDMPDSTMQFLAGTGLSVAQNVANLPQAAINPALPLASMSTQAAASKAAELNRAGSAPGSALARGITAGAIEAVTEKIPLENVLRLAKEGGTGAIRELLKQSGIEASEEGASYVLNYLADKAANDPDATFDARELVGQMAGGALSGAVMGGGAQVTNRVLQGRVDPLQYGKTPLEAVQEQRTAQGMQTDTESTQRRADALQYGKTPLEAVQEQRAAQGMQTDTESAQRRADALQYGKTPLEAVQEQRTAQVQDAQTQAIGQAEPILRQGTWQEGEVKPRLRPEYEERPRNMWDDYGTQWDQDAISGLESPRPYLPDADQARIAALEAGETPTSAPDSYERAQGQLEALGSDSYRVPDIIDAEERAVRTAENYERAQGQLAALGSDSYRMPDLQAAQDADHLRAGGEQADIMRAWQDVKRAEAQRDTVRAEIQLTAQDERYLQSALISGSTSNFFEADNPQDLLYVYQAEQAIRDARRPITEQNAQRREALSMEAAEYADAVAAHATDKARGLAYQRETMERNIYDIFGKEHRAEAEQINKTYFEPVHKAAAESNRIKNEYRRRVAELKLDKHESALVQMMLENETGAAADYIRKNELHITPQQNMRLERARDTMRDVYKALYEQINDALLRNGQEPVPYRENYAPHFTIDKPDTAIGRLRYRLGLGKSADTLPTDLAGITENFRPGKKWFGNLLQRKGELTDFDVVYGFDQYVETAAEVITQTDNIQRLRALEDAVRYRLSDEGTQAKIDAIEQNYELDALERMKQKEHAYDDNMTTAERMTHEFVNQKRMGMRGLVTELRRYTDILAGKKSKDDRTFEDALGRGIYELSRKVEGRVAADMIAANPGSWLTNFIPITQANAEVSTLNLLRGMRDTVTSYVKDDGFVDTSTFLTNRRGSERLTRTTLRKIGDALGKPMDIIDEFTADTIVRARTAQNMQNGLTLDAAIDEADAFAAGLMADRSKGALPTLFEAKNPVMKAFTMFQLEPNNQLSYIFKDIPRRLGEEGAKAIAFALTKIFFTGFLFNKLYKELTGRDAAFDPIGAVADAFGIGEDDDKERNAGDVVKSLRDSTLEQLPFTSVLNAIGFDLDQGRIPVTAAIPDLGKIGSSFDSDKAPEKRKQMLMKELAKPAAYLLPPFGGGAIKKAVEGFRTVRDGGAYELDNDGNKQLLFPAYGQKPIDYVKPMLFGRYSSKEATAYVDSGFKRASVPTTQAYDMLRGEDIDNARAYEIATGISGMTAEGDDKRTDKQRAYIMAQEDLTPSQKWRLDKLLVGSADSAHAVDYTSSDSFALTIGANENQQRAIHQMNARLGTNITHAVQVMQEIGSIGRSTEGEKNENRRRALFAREDLSAEEKEAFDLMLTGAERPADYSSKDEFWLTNYVNDDGKRLSEAAVDKARMSKTGADIAYPVFVSAYEQLSGMESDKDAAGESLKNVSYKKKAYIDSIEGLSSAQRKMLYEAFGVSKTAQGISTKKSSSKSSTGSSSSITISTSNLGKDFPALPVFK